MVASSSGMGPTGVLSAVRAPGSWNDRRREWWPWECHLAAEARAVVDDARLGGATLKFQSGNDLGATLDACLGYRYPPRLFVAGRPVVARPILRVMRRRANPRVRRTAPRKPGEDAASPLSCAPGGRSGALGPVGALTGAHRLRRFRGIDIRLEVVAVVYVEVLVGAGCRLET